MSIAAPCYRLTLREIHVAEGITFTLATPGLSPADLGTLARHCGHAVYLIPVVCECGHGEWAHEGQVNPNNPTGDLIVAMKTLEGIVDLRRCRECGEGECTGYRPIRPCSHEVRA